MANTLSTWENMTITIIVQSLAVDVHRAKRLAKAGQELMAEYSFTKDVLESKCLELKSLCKKLEIMFTKKRQSLLKFLELFQTLESISKVPIYLYSKCDAMILNR